MLSLSMGHTAGSYGFYSFISSKWELQAASAVSVLLEREISAGIKHKFRGDPYSRSGSK